MMSYSMLDVIKIVVDAELWWFFITYKLAITGNDNVFLSFWE